MSGPSFLEPVFGPVSLSYVHAFVLISPPQSSQTRCPPNRSPPQFPFHHITLLWPWHRGRASASLLMCSFKLDSERDIWMWPEHTSPTPMAKPASSMLYVSTRPTGDPLVPKFPRCAPDATRLTSRGRICGPTTFIFDSRKARHYFVSRLRLPQLVGNWSGTIDIIAPGTPDGCGQRGSDLGPPVTAEPNTRGAPEQYGPLSSCVRGVC